MKYVKEDNFWVIASTAPLSAGTAIEKELKATRANAPIKRFFRKENFIFKPVFKDWSAFDYALYCDGFKDYVTNTEQFMQTVRKISYFQFSKK